jgi:hypothetical protein
MSSAATDDNMVRGFAFGRLAIRIIESHSVPPEVACPVYNFFASHILLWHRPLGDTQRYFLAAITKGLETYDITWTSAAVIDRGVFSFFAGESLDLVQAKLEEAEPLIRKGKQETGKHWLSMPMEFVRSLRGDMNGSHLDPTPALEKAQMYQSHTHLFTFHCYQLISAVFMGQTEIGLTAAKACEMYLVSATGSLLWGMYFFYSAVLLVDNFDNLLQPEVNLLQKKMDMLRLWSRTAPSTFEHKYKFLRVMSSRKGPNLLRLLDGFDEAIFLALQAGHGQDAALYAERCSRWLVNSSPVRSVQYLEFAKRHYDYWGAGAKVKQINEAQPAGTRLLGFCISFACPITEYSDSSESLQRVQGSL